jgi:hypothetical protein
MMALAAGLGVGLALVLVAALYLAIFLPCRVARLVKEEVAAAVEPLRTQLEDHAAGVALHRAILEIEDGIEVPSEVEEHVLTTLGVVDGERRNPRTHHGPLLGVPEAPPPAGSLNTPSILVSTDLEEAALARIDALAEERGVGRDEMLATIIRSGLPKEEARLVRAARGNRGAS